MNRVRLVSRVALLSVAAAALGALAAGCTFQVRADPNDPLYGARSFSIEPVTMANLFVGDKPEAVYLGGKNPDQQKSWEADKAAMAATFGNQLIATAGSRGVSITPLVPGSPPAPFILRINFDHVEPGNFNGFVNFATQVRLTLVVLNAQGQPVGQTPLNTSVPASLGNPSSGGRMRQAGEQLGVQTARYLFQRAGLGY